MAAVGAQTAPTAPAAATFGAVGSAAGLPAFTFQNNTRVICLTNGAGAGGLLQNHRKTSGPIQAAEWPHNTAVHHHDIFLSSWLMAVGRDAAAVVAGTARGFAKGSIPGRGMLFCLYLIQTLARYMLDSWAANAGEHWTETTAVPATGVVGFTTGAHAPPTHAAVLASLTAAGYTAPGGGAVAALATGAIPFEKVPSPAEMAVLNVLSNGNLAFCFAAETLGLVALQLAADGHHFDPSNRVTDKLMTDSPLDFKSLSTALAGAVGGSESDHRACIVHKALHSMSSAAIIAWATTAQAEHDLCGIGMEALSIRFPLTSPMGHAADARLACIEKYLSVSAGIGAVVNLSNTRAVLTALTQLPHAVKVANDAAIATALAQTDEAGAFAAGWLSGYYDSMRMKAHSTIKGRSIIRLEESNGDSWSRGAAQGASAAEAYRAEGVQHARPVDPVYVPTGVAAIDTPIAGVPVAPLAPKAKARPPATIPALNRVKEAHQAATAQHQTAVAIAVATAKAPPAAPPAIDYSGCF